MLICTWSAHVSNDGVGAPVRQNEAGCMFVNTAGIVTDAPARITVEHAGTDSMTWPEYRWVTRMVAHPLPG